MTSIERSHCAECVSPNITMEYELPVVKYAIIIQIVIVSEGTVYGANSREVLVLVIDCTCSIEYMEFIKTLLCQFVSKYREEADICKCTTMNTKL